MNNTCEGCQEGWKISCEDCKSEQKDNPMTDYEKQYKDETGKDAYIVEGPRDNGYYNPLYTQWLIQTADRLADDNCKHLLTIGDKTKEIDRLREELDKMTRLYSGCIKGHVVLQEKLEKAESERDELIDQISGLKQFYQRCGILAWDDIDGLINRIRGKEL